MSDPFSPQTWELVQQGGDRPQPSESAMPEGPYRGEGYPYQKGPSMEHPTACEARQGPLAVYDRGRTRETEQTLSDSFNMTKH